MATRRISKRQFLGQLGALAGAAAAGTSALAPQAAAATADLATADPGRRAAATRALARRRWDVIVVGAGNAGLPAAIFAARRGASVLVIEAAERIGGSLLLSSGQMSAAGTVLQKSLGIEDSAQHHYDDIMRISQGTANPAIVRLAVDHAGPMADWLIGAGFTPREGHPVLGGGGHDPYSRARYFWGENGGLSILRVLERELQPQVDAGRVTVLLQTKASALLQKRAGGAVSGVIATGPDGAAVEYRGRSVVLTSGGYGSNPAMFEQIEGIRDYADTVYPYSQGAGITMGLAAGGWLRGAEMRQPLFNAVLQDDAVPSPILLRLVTDPLQRPPWEIFVNLRGERFLCEDTPSFDAKEKALKQQPQERCWVVFDDAILQASPSMSRGWKKQEIIEGFGTYPLFYKADSLAALAAATGVDAAGLAATVADYNAGQAVGRDRLGRTHLPLPIARAPFYAIRMQGYYLLDTAGLAVDGALRAIRPDGRPIPNLYVAGELIGMGTLQGSSYCGGMSVTPALTFGKLLGERLLPV
jgi:fumarate reductase flavoprotein subunit